MNIYKELIVKILERSSFKDDPLVEKIKKNIDLTQKELRQLEELIDLIV